MLRFSFAAVIVASVLLLLLAGGLSLTEARIDHLLSKQQRLKETETVKEKVLTCLTGGTEKRVADTHPLVKWETACEKQKAWVEAAKKFYNTAQFGATMSVLKPLLAKMVEHLPEPYSHPMKDDAISAFVENIKEDDERRKAVKTYLKETKKNHITYATFSGALRTICEDAYNKAVEKGLPIRVWLTNEGGAKSYMKSQYWIFAHCLKFVPALADAITRIGIGGLGMSNPASTIFFFDDMSYSGEQLSKDFQGVINSFPSGSSAFLVVPYVTIKARMKIGDTIIEIYPSRTGRNVELFSMNGFHEAVQEPIKPFDSELQKRLTTMYEEPGANAVYLDHKLADFKSVQAKLLQGYYPPAPYVVEAGRPRAVFYDNCDGLPADFICPTEPYKLTLPGIIKD